jgi:hypothetical protein
MAWNGAQANGGSSAVGISGHGRYRLFRSSASNIVRGDTNRVADIFVRVSHSRAARRCSVGSAGEEPNRPARAGALSRNGQWVVWKSAATNLDPADDNGLADLFIRGSGC